MLLDERHRIARETQIAVGETKQATAELRRCLAALARTACREQIGFEPFGGVPDPNPGERAHLLTC
jgi:hypothetical protein